MNVILMDKSTDLTEDVTESGHDVTEFGRNLTERGGGTLNKMITTSWYNLES